MKRRFRLVSCLAAALAVSSEAGGAATLGINFHNADYDFSTGISATESAIGIPGSNWSNLAIAGASGAPSGSGTLYGGLIVTWNASLAYQAGSEGFNGTDASQQVFRVYLDDGDGGSSYFNGDGYGVSVQVSGLSSFLGTNKAPAYSVTLYFSTDSTSFVTAQIKQGLLTGTPSATTISSLTQLGTISAQTPLGDGTYPVATGAGTATDGHRGVGTLSGLTADSITIALPSNPGANGVRGSLAGFSIATVPEPSVSLMLGGLGLAGLLRRRR